jgi:hypothetical protein
LLLLLFARSLRLRFQIGVKLITVLLLLLHFFIVPSQWVIDLMNCGLCVVGEMLDRIMELLKNGLEVVPYRLMGIRRLVRLFTL